MTMATNPLTNSLSKRRAAYHKGVGAEANAATMLAGLGYEILSRRYRSPAGEIDLVAAKEGHLSFVEVKSRKNIDDAALSVTPRQQRRIADAAGYWLQAYPEYTNCDMSFDAILYGSGRTAYITDAFRM